MIGRENGAFLAASSNTPTKSARRSRQKDTKWPTIDHYPTTKHSLPSNDLTTSRTAWKRFASALHSFPLTEITASNLPGSEGHVAVLHTFPRRPLVVGVVVRDVTRSTVLLLERAQLFGGRQRRSSDCVCFKNDRTRLSVKYRISFDVTRHSRVLHKMTASYLSDKFSKLNVV